MPTENHHSIVIVNYI